jgi:hypothetical protein
MQDDNDIKSLKSTGVRDLGNLMGLGPEPRMKENGPDIANDQAGPKTYVHPPVSNAKVSKPSSGWLLRKGIRVFLKALEG